MEVHCGEWEMRSWDELPKEEVDPWMADFVQVRIPGGESYLDLHQRVTQCWESIRRDGIRSTMAVNAGGAGAGDVAIVCAWRCDPQHPVGDHRYAAHR
jgi:broad specificity phosphatase PhoE